MTKKPLPKNLENIGKISVNEKLDVRELFSTIGGFRGLIESVTPGFLFLIVYLINGNLLPSVIAPVAVAIIILFLRLLQSLPLMPAISGGIGIALSAGFALWTGRPEDNFVGGFITNAVWLLALLISLIARKPLVSLAVSLFVANEQTVTPQFKRAGWFATFLWAGFFALRLAVQFPLWLAGNTVALASTKLIMGLPFYTAMLWISWLVMRGSLKQKTENTADD